MAKQPAPFDESVYRSARSTRPSWANWLIVAGVLLIAAIAAVLMGGLNTMSVLLFTAAIVVALVGGVLALVGVRRR